MFFRKLRQGLRRNHRFRTRADRHHLAVDVPPSRKEVAMKRRRMLGNLLKGAAVLGLALWGGVETIGLWQRAFTRSPEYAVGQFELLTNGAVTASQVTAATGLRPDTHIASLDLGQLRRQLLTLPQVCEVAIERRLPNHLSVRIEERRPAAWLACDGQGLEAFSAGGLLLDAEGVAFPAEVMLNEYTTLPVIRCKEMPAVTRGRRVDSTLVLQALELVRLMRQQVWPKPMGLERIHVLNRFTLVAQMDNDALFTFRPVDLEKQMARLQAILVKVASSPNRVTSVNLQLERNVPVRFAEAPLPVVQKASGKSLKPAPGARRPASRQGT